MGQAEAAMVADELDLRGSSYRKRISPATSSERRFLYGSRKVIGDRSCEAPAAVVLQEDDDDSKVREAPGIANGAF